MELFEVVFRHLPIKIWLAVDSYRQKRNEKDTAFSMQTSIVQYAPQKLLQNWNRGLVAFSTRSGKKHIFGGVRFVRAIQKHYTWKCLRLCLGICQSKQSYLDAAGFANVLAGLRGLAN